MVLGRTHEPRTKCPGGGGGGGGDSRSGGTCGYPTTSLHKKADNICARL